MDNIEILINDIDVGLLNKFLKDRLGIKKTNVINSHFFDDSLNRDFEFFDKMNLVKYFSETRTGNMFVSKLFVGVNISEVMVIITSENMKADVELSFGEDAFENISHDEAKLKVKKIAKYLLALNKEFSINQLTIGYNPISDNKLNLLVFKDNKISVCTEMNNKLSVLIRDDICWDELDLKQISNERPERNQ